VLEKLTDEKSRVIFDSEKVTNLIDSFNNEFITFKTLEKKIKKYESIIDRNKNTKTYIKYY